MKITAFYRAAVFIIWCIPIEAKTSVNGLLHSLYENVHEIVQQAHTGLTKPTEVNIITQEQLFFELLCKEDLEGLESLLKKQGIFLSKDANRRLFAAVLLAFSSKKRCATFSMWAVRLLALLCIGNSIRALQALRLPYHHGHRWWLGLFSSVIVPLIATHSLHKIAFKIERQRITLHHIAEYITELAKQYDA